MTESQKIYRFLKTMNERNKITKKMHFSVDHYSDTQYIFHRGVEFIRIQISISQLPT